MFERFEDLQLTVFVSFVLQNFFYCYFLASYAYMAKEYCPECALSRHTVDFILFSGCDIFHMIGSTNFADFPTMKLMALVGNRVQLIGFRFDILVQKKWFGGVDFEGFTSETLFRLYFGVDFKVARLVGLFMGFDTMGGRV
jgi:hypothetical protein